VVARESLRIMSRDEMLWSVVRIVTEGLMGFCDVWGRIGRDECERTEEWLTLV
jgi:hypothetical protein